MLLPCNSIAFGLLPFHFGCQHQKRLSLFA
nr:MAG TPA: hypothetical protein [Caudoviricetes sp.]